MANPTNDPFDLGAEIQVTPVTETPATDDFDTLIFEGKEYEKNLPVKGPVSSHDALDILEAVEIEDVQKLDTQGSPLDIDYVEEKISKDRARVEAGEDSRKVNTALFEQEQELNRNAAFDTVMSQLLDSNLSDEARNELLMKASEFPEVDTFFEDLDTSVTSLLSRNFKRKLFKFAADPTQVVFSKEEESYIWDTFMEWSTSNIRNNVGMLSAFQGALERPEVAVFKQKFSKGNLTPEDMAGFKEGFLDELMLSWMYIPEWLHGRMYTGTPEGEQVKEDMLAYRAILDEKKKQSGIMYRVGGDAGSTTGLVFDPVLDIGPLAAAPVKMTMAAAKGARTTKKLSSILGPGVLASLSELSATDLALSIKQLRELNPTKFKQVQAVARGGDPLSDAFKIAIRDADTVVDEGRITLSRTSAGADMAHWAVKKEDNAARQALVKAALAANHPQTTPKMVQTLTDALGTNRYVKFTLLPDIPHSGVLRPSTDFGTFLNNATSISHVVGRKAEWSLMQSATEEFIGQSRVRVYNRDINLSLTGDWRGQSGSRFFGFNFSPRDLFKRSARADLVHEPILAVREERRLNKVFAARESKIFSSVPRAERDDFINMLEMGNEYQRHWVKSGGGMELQGVADTWRKVSPKTQAALRAYRQHNKDMYRLTNEAMLKTMETQGHKYHPKFEEVAYKQTKIPAGTEVTLSDGSVITWGDEYVGVGNTVWSIREAGPTGYVNKLHMMTPDEVDSILKEIPKNHKALGEVQGEYFTRMYTQPYTVHQLEMTKAGEIVAIKPVGTAKTLADGTVFANKFARPDNGLFYLVDRSGGGMSDVVTQADFFRHTQELSSPAFERFIETLKSGGFSEGGIEALRLSRERYGGFHQTFMHSRGDELVDVGTATKDPATGGFSGKPAPHKPPKEAARIYSQKVARYTSQAHLHEELLKDFKSQYGKYLQDANDAFSAPISGLAHDLHQEISLYQRQLKNITGRKTLLDDMVEGARQWAVDKLVFSKRPLVSMVGTGIDKVLPTLAGTAGVVKTVTRQSLMGLGAVVQLPLQFGSAYIKTLAVQGLAPTLRGDVRQSLHNIVGAHQDFVGILAPYVTGGKATMSKKYKELWELLERSGVSAGVDLEAFGTLATDPRNMRSLTTGWFQKTKKGVEFATSGWAVAGEQGGQIFAWLAAKRELDYAIKAGKASHVVGSQKYLDAITMRSTRIAHDMGKANRAGMSSGDILSTITTLKRFGFDEAALMLNLGGDLKKSEVVSLWATAIGLFGYQGIPGIQDALVAAEWAADQSGVPDKSGSLQLELGKDLAEYAAEKAAEYGLPYDTTNSFIYRALNQGLVSAATGGQVAIAPRMAVASVYGSFLRGASMDEALLGAAYSTVKNFMEAGIISTETVFDSLREFGVEGLNQDLAATVFKQVTEPIVGVSKNIQAYEAATKGEIRNKKGDLLTDTATLADVLTLAMGETPGRIKNIQELNRAAWLRKDRMKEWLKVNAKAVAEKFAEGNPEMAKVHMNRVRDELKEAGYAEVGASFLMTCINEQIKKDMPQDFRTEIDMLFDPLIEENLRDIMNMELH